MELEDILNEIIDSYTKLKKSIEETIMSQLDDSDKDVVQEKFNYIFEFLGNIVPNYQKFLDGEILYILTCNNNYIWAVQTLQALVKMLKVKWNESVEEIRMKILDKNLAAQTILIESHNSIVEDKNSPDIIQDFDPLENKVLTIYYNYFQYELYDLLKEKLNELKEDELTPAELETLEDLRNIPELK